MDMDIYIYTYIYSLCTVKSLYSRTEVVHGALSAGGVFLEPGVYYTWTYTDIYTSQYICIYMYIYLYICIVSRTEVVHGALSAGGVLLLELGGGHVQADRALASVSGLGDGLHNLSGASIVELVLLVVVVVVAVATTSAAG